MNELAVESKITAPVCWKENCGLVLQYRLPLPLASNTTAGQGPPKCTVWVPVTVMVTLAVMVCEPVERWSGIETVNWVWTNAKEPVLPSEGLQEVVLTFWEEPPVPPVEFQCGV